jgi:type VI secretion system secreted protein Hcp
MSVNAVMKISGAQGETKMTGIYEKEKWIELQGWDWEVEAETSWTKGGGASVGKPNPGKMNWEHYFDTSSCRILNFIFSGQSFEKMELHMLKGTGNKMGQEVFFKMFMEGVFITKVTSTATEEGNVTQKVEMVFKEVKFEYRPQNDGTVAGKPAGKLGDTFMVKWDIPAGKVEG